MRMPPLDYIADLGCLGNRAALVIYDSSVSWARHPSEGFNDVHINLVSLEVFMPGINEKTGQWEQDHSLLDLSAFLLSPAGAMLKQQIETEIEEKYADQIVRYHEGVHTPDRLGDAI